MPPAHPTLINLPPPPSNPDTPSDIPGTPNSTTTSMSELSTVAIKDGHRGHLSHHNRQAAQPDAERADRISRLAGLERVATGRSAASSNNLTPGAAALAGAPSGYFDPSGNPTMGRERSTVGSASATGSVGGRTTWASGSNDMYDRDQMSESADMDMDTSSVGGMSDEQNSLVGFGEGARTPARQSAYGSPGIGGGKATPTAQQQFSTSFAGRDASMTPVNAQTAAEQRTARYIDGQTSFDTNDRGATRGAGVVGGGAGADAERILKERLGDGGAMDGPESSKDLGRFDFERT